MICLKCKADLPEKDIQEHHLHPRFMDNPTGLGMKIPLCKKHHDMLHLIIASIIWKLIGLKTKPEMIDAVKSFTLRWVQ